MKLFCSYIVSLKFKPSFRVVVIIPNWDIRGSMQNTDDVHAPSHISLLSSPDHRVILQAGQPKRSIQKAIECGNTHSCRYYVLSFLLLIVIYIFSNYSCKCALYAYSLYIYIYVCTSLYKYTVLQLYICSSRRVHTMAHGLPSARRGAVLETLL